MYAEGKSRIQTYNEMVERVLQCLYEGQMVCLACYGHPGVFVYPSHESIRRARAQGYDARMLPGISAEDCLFSDLGVDPAAHGCQSYEATDFLANGRCIDPSSSVILWQIGVVGDSTFKKAGYDLSAFPLLIERLLQYYPATHVVYLYEAATFPGCGPTILPIQIVSLGQAPLTAGHTLYIPPARATLPDHRIYARMVGLQAQSPTI